MSMWIGGMVAMAAQDFMASLIAKVAMSASERLFKRGESVTIPVSVLQDLLTAQANSAGQTRALLNQLQIAVDELSRERVIHIIEAPTLAINFPAAFVEAAASFAPAGKVIEGTVVSDQPGIAPMKSEDAHAETPVWDSGKASLASFRERMIRAYPGRDLEWD